MRHFLLLFLIFVILIVDFHFVVVVLIAIEKFILFRFTFR